MGSPETQAPDPLIKSQIQREPTWNIDKKAAALISLVVVV
jgi:hypothetical protein